MRKNRYFSSNDRGRIAIFDRLSWKKLLKTKLLILTIILCSLKLKRGIFHVYHPCKTIYLCQYFSTYRWLSFGTVKQSQHHLWSGPPLLFPSMLFKPNIRWITLHHSSMFIMVSKYPSITIPFLTINKLIPNAKFYLNKSQKILIFEVSRCKHL